MKGLAERAKDDVALDTDQALRAEVLRELEWDPEVDETRIAVSVESGVVTLAGHVSSYPEKVAAVRAVERVFGVRAVADELVVEPPDERLHDDADIAEAIAKELRWNALVPDTVKAEVRHGVVELRGEVEWFFQREEAERAVQAIEGITGVLNRIVVKPRSTPTVSELRKQVTDALKRVAALDASQISVNVLQGGTVILTGRVHSLYEKELAERIARSAPGSSKLVNELVVEPEPRPEHPQPESGSSKRSRPTSRNPRRR
jgi:osmotically-inducible protein OsmY